ncbi:hypothetical protein HOC73_04790, partial [bacterium]|nr:hypothetical protein [bacterium]
MRFIKNNLFILILLVVVSFFLIPNLSFAQTDLGLEPVAETGLGSSSLPELIVRIIQIALGFLGILALIVILYGGYTWLSSGGNQDKVADAKKILVNGVIGLVIILSAFSIVTFLITRIFDATGGEALYCEIGQVEECSMSGDCEREKTCIDNGEGNGVWGDCEIIYSGECSPLSDSEFFRLTATAPANGDELNIANVVVQLTFNNNVGDFNAIDLSEGEGVTIVQRSTNNLVPLVGEVSNNPKKLNIYPDKDQAGYACTGHPDLACFPYDSIDDLNNWYTVTVLTEGVVLTNSSGTEVSCLDIPCVFEFKTGFSVDTENPVVDLISAVSNGQFDWNNSDNIDINISESFLFNSQASDDAGLASSNFFENQITLSSTPDLGQGLFLSLIPWSPEDLGYQVSDVKQVGAEVTDYAGNSTQSIKQVTLFSATCYNEIQDGDEIGIDCGGSCPACSDENVDNPIITSIDPPNGASGNWITIYGSGFGESQGTIKYRDQLGNINYIGVPSLGMLVCESPWNDTWIIMEIPDIDLGLVDLQVVRFNSSISSNWYEDFDVNTIQRPGICLMTSDDGYYNDELNIIGHSFGDNTDVRDIFFGQSVERVSASNQSFSIEGSIEHAYGNVPYLESGQTVVRVEIDGEESNGLYFTVIDSNQESSISFSPDSGNVGEYITIYGSGFGDFKGEGTVYFNNNIEGSFDFPDACGTNYWSDDQIVVKVPVGSSDGALRVETDSGYVVTSSTFFDFNNTLDISPGICSITPNSGLIDTPVYIAGEFSEDVLVNFSGIELSDVDIDNNEITILVPNVSSGLVNLEEPTGAESNSVNFSVGQTSQGGEPNDDYFEWQFTTCEDCLIPEVEENGICSNGDLASPSPRPYSTDGFIDQDVTITFNSTMDHSTFIANDSVILEVCDGLEVNCTSSNWSFVLGDNRNSVVLNPDNDFNADTWYRITLTEDIANFEYNMDAEYSWSFKTAQENLQCTADSVIISPYDRREGSTLGPIELNEYVNYSASGVNSNNCASCSDDFEWEWESNDPGAVISDTNLSTNQLHAEGLISSNQEIIIAQIIDVEPYPIGNAYLNIVEETGNQDNEPGDDQLLLVDYQPVGDQVCLNTLAQVEFNHGLSDNGLSQFSFFKCSTSEGDCPTLGEGGNWISAGSDITFNNNNTLVSMSPSSGLLDPDFDYRIIMYSGDPDILGESRISTDDGLFLNQEGCEYGGGNWFQGMQWCYWIFSTVDERCEVDSIGISPNNVINNINDTQDWQATAYDQEGLALTDVVDSWTVNDSEIASIVDNGDNTATTDSLSSGSTWLYTDIDIDNIRGEAWLEVEPSIVNPQIISTQPIGQEYFCTNSLVEVTFDQYLKRETVNQNTFELNQFSDTDLGGCIAFDETIAFGEPTNLINKFTDVYFNKFISNLTSKLVNYVFNKVYAIVPDWIPQSGYWCPLNNSGEWILDNIGGEGRVKFQLNEVLPGNSSIQVLIQGGQGGVLSIQDLPLDINSDTYDYYFNTSDTYCELSFLQVSTDLETYSPEYTFNISEDSSNLDENDPLSGNFDTINDYDKAFYVTGFSQNGQALTSVPGEYEWIWRWNSEDTSIALTTDSVNYSEYYDADYDGNYNVVLAANNNGETDITAHAVFI